MDVRGTRIARLLNDPLIGGDLLLVAIALASVYDFGWDAGGKIDQMAANLWPGNTELAHRHIRSVFKQDIRTYRPPLGYDLDTCVRRCTGPMVRRDACGRPATTWNHTTDWGTGEKAYVGACNRHAGWFSAEVKANRAAKPDLVPLPYANHGGVLIPHFPRLNWPAFWRRLDPRWVEHPERTVRPRPDLELILGEGSSPGSTPLLWVVPAGGAS